MSSDRYVDKNLQNLIIKFYETFASDLRKYFHNVAETVVVSILLHLLICFLIYKSVQNRKKVNVTLQGAKRALIVIAHPDDECMFFGPTIVNLNQQGTEVYLLCLSKGNYYKKGNLRHLELYKACETLNIKSRCITLCIDASLPDDPNVHWPCDHVASIIHHHIESLSIDTLITFDKAGVSHHINHSSIFYAIARLFIEKHMPKECRVFTLDSVNILRKYWGYLDLPFSYVLSTHWFVLTLEDRNTIFKAMKEHKSQMVWFRYLYLLFSRYIVINTLRHVTLVDLELELQLDD